MRLKLFSLRRKLAVSTVGFAFSILLAGCPFVTPGQAPSGGEGSGTAGVFQGAFTFLGGSLVHSRSQFKVGEYPFGTGGNTREYSYRKLVGSDKEGRTFLVDKLDDPATSAIPLGVEGQVSLFNITALIHDWKIGHVRPPIVAGNVVLPFMGNGNAFVKELCIQRLPNNEYAAVLVAGTDDDSLILAAIAPGNEVPFVGAYYQYVNGQYQYTGGPNGTQMMYSAGDINSPLFDQCAAVGRSPTGETFYIYGDIRFAYVEEIE